MTNRVDGVDRVELPVAAATMGVREALALIDGRSGGVVVAQADGGGHVLSAEDLLRALRAGDSGPLSEVGVLRQRGEAPEPVASITVSPAQGAGALVVGAAALVQGLPPGQAVRLSQAVNLYVCSLDDTHVFMADELFRPGRCNLDGAAVNPL